MGDTRDSDRIRTDIDGFNQPMTVSPADVPTERPTILVADDETALTDSMALWLSDEYVVRTAYTGDEALDAYDASVDIVLVDRRMPGLSGDELIDRLAATSHPPKIALLTATDAATIDDEFDAGAVDERLTKPISKTDLLAAVDRLARRLTDADDDTRN
jgi:CheY-like chemotaxis protein